MFCHIVSSWMSADFDIVVIPFVSPLSFYGSRICSDGGTVCSVFIPSCLWLRLERWEQYNDFRLVKIFCRKRHIQQQQRHTVYQRNNFAGRKNVWYRFHHRDSYALYNSDYPCTSNKNVLPKLNYEMNLSSKISSFNQTSTKLINKVLSLSSETLPPYWTCPTW